MTAMVYVGHVAQPFNHVKQLFMLRLSSSYLIRNNFPCHFLSLAISKYCFSWDCFNRFPALAAVTAFPSVVTHTGFRVSSWRVIIKVIVYFRVSSGSVIIIIIIIYYYYYILLLYIIIIIYYYYYYILLLLSSLSQAFSGAPVCQERRGLLDYDVLD